MIIEVMKFNDVVSIIPICKLDRKGLDIWRGWHQHHERATMKISNDSTEAQTRAVGSRPGEIESLVATLFTHKSTDNEELQCALRYAGLPSSVSPKKVVGVSPPKIAMP